MKQRGRKSAENLVAIDVTGTPPRLTAPSGLTKSERALFNEIVAGCAADHFRESDKFLLVSLVQAIALSRRAVRGAARAPGQLAAWERSTRLVTTLATKLRLTVQSRVDPKTIGRMQPIHTGPRPWELGG